MAANSAQSDAQIYARIKASIPPNYDVQPLLGSLLYEVWRDEGTKLGVTYPTRDECEVLVTKDIRVRDWTRSGWSKRSFYGLRGYCTIQT